MPAKLFRPVIPVFLLLTACHAGLEHSMAAFELHGPGPGLRDRKSSPDSDPTDPTGTPAPQTAPLGITASDPGQSEDPPESAALSKPGDPSSSAGTSPTPGSPATDLETRSPGSLSPGWTEHDGMRLANIEEGVRSRLTIQQVLNWYTQTQGEESITSETYRGREALFSTDTLQFLDRARARKDLEPEEARALDYLKSNVAREYIQLRISPFNDRIAKAEGSATARLPWLSAPVPFRQLDGLAMSQSDPQRRQEIEAAIERVWSQTLNPLMNEKEEQVRSLAVDAGYPSYIAMAEQLRSVDLKPLIEQTAAFLRETDGLYRKMLDQEAHAVLGKPASKLTRADLRYLLHPPKLKRFFPGELERAVFESFLDGIGLDLQTSAGTPIQIDDSSNEGKAAGAECVPVRVPRDIRLSLAPSDGVMDFGATFHEGGHALYYANIVTPVFAFQSMGSEAPSEAYAEFFRLVWDDPVWLKHYRRLIEARNLKDPKRRIPVMSDRDIAQVVRHRAFWDLYYIRRIAFARLTYGAILHGGAPELYRAVYEGPVDDLQAVYQRIFSQAYGVELSRDEALRFRTDADEMLESADFARSFQLAHRLHQEMRARFGEEWFNEPRAGTLLKSLWRDGSRWTADEVARKLDGVGGLSYEPVKARLTRLLSEAAALEVH